MQVSKGFFELLEEIEGRNRKMYIDSGGAPTIGIGHLFTKEERMSGKIYINGNYIKYADGLSDDQVDDLVIQDVKLPVYAVNTLSKVTLNQNQFEALVSFVYNIGNIGFKNSTLLKLLRTGDYASVPAQMRRWNIDNGKVVKGLVNRREKEISHWNKPV